MSVCVNKLNRTLSECGHIPWMELWEVWALADEEQQA